MFTAIFGIAMSFGIVALTVWGLDQIEDYMSNDNLCEEFTVFNA